MDPFALPCHPDLLIGPDDRDWRSIGVRSADDVLRKQTRCPVCKTAYTAYLAQCRTGPHGGVGATHALPRHRVRRRRPAAAVAGRGRRRRLPRRPGEPDLRALQEQTAGLGDAWDRSVQLVAPARVLTTAGRVFAAPGDALLERREKWNAQDRRLALLWAPRLQRPVVAWHGFARLLQAEDQHVEGPAA